MRDPLTENEADYEIIRGDPALTVENFIRWERVKLREASRDAIQLLESGAQPTREYLDYMFTSDVGMREIRNRISKHQDRIAELEAMRTNAALDL
ncbi:MAG: hypothetical protein M3N26_01490 [Pseudomonadota bacterium]|nr:hypothetical protein [Pseudomonadota bacterium]